MRIWIIAKIGVKECLRYRVVYFVFGMAVLFVLLGKGCNPGTIKGEGILYDESALAGLTAGLVYHCLSFWCMLLCGFLAAQALAREVENATAALTLSRPVSRTEFVTGRLLSVVLVALLNAAVLSGVFTGLFCSETGIVYMRVVLSGCYLGLNMLLYALLNMLLSQLLPRMAAPLAGLLLLTASFWCALPVYVTKLLMLWEPSRTVKMLYAVLPRFGDLQFISVRMLMPPDTPVAVLIPLLHTALTGVVLWIANVYLFTRRQL